MTPAEVDRYGGGCGSTLAKSLKTLSGTLAEVAHFWRRLPMQAFVFIGGGLAEVGRKSVPHTPYTLPPAPERGAECVGGVGECA